MPSDKKLLFQKFLNNQCTREELEEVMGYLRDDKFPPEFEAMLQENLEQKLRDKPQLPTDSSARMLHNIQAAIQPVQHKAKVRTLYRRLMAVAATIVLCIGCGLLYFYLPGFQSSRIYATDYGEKTQIVLPDGSSVMLNANSRLTLSTDWDKGGLQDTAFVREVWLEGEAFFEVEKLPLSNRFVVHTGELHVEVLGTKFNVNSRENKTRVVLDEGKVKVKAHHDAELIMQPGEMVELAQDASDFQKKEVNPNTYASWRNNELIFEATPVTEIIDLLKNNYGYEVIIRNQAVNDSMLFTGKAPADEVALLLSMLSESFNIRVFQKDGMIVFQ